MRTRTPLDLDFSKITQFNPLIIANQVPETSPISYDPEHFDFLLCIVSQLQDVFNAYCFAQDDILPKLNHQNRIEVTAEHILNWISQIHLRMANTLSYEHGLIEKQMGFDVTQYAGRYTSRQVFRWVTSTEIHEVISVYFYSQKSPDVKSLASLLAIFGVEIEVAKRFAALFIQTANSDIEISPEQLKYIKVLSPQTTQAMRALDKLATAYHQNRFNADEVNVINQVVKICPPLDITTQRMQQFAERLAARWQVLDVSNQDEVIALAAYAYQQLTYIHPFFNCNGRTACCLMNIILVASGQPSIVFRSEEDRDNPVSTYNRAIACIDQDLKPLEAHIKSRIEAAEQSHDPEQLDLIASRVSLAQTYFAYQNQFGHQAFQALFTENMKVQDEKLGEYQTSDFPESELPDVPKKIIIKLLKSEIKKVRGLVDKKSHAGLFSSSYSGQLQQLEKKVSELVTDAETVSQQHNQDVNYDEMVEQLKQKFIMVVSLKTKLPKAECLPAHQQLQLERVEEGLASFRAAYNQVKKYAEEQALTQQGPALALG